MCVPSWAAANALIILYSYSIAETLKQPYGKNFALRTAVFIALCLQNLVTCKNVRLVFYTVLFRNFPYNSARHSGRKTVRRNITRNNAPGTYNTIVTYIYTGANRHARSEPAVVPYVNRRSTVFSPYRLLFLCRCVRPQPADAAELRLLH